MESTLNLIDIFKILKKRWKLISLFIIGTGVVSAAVTFYVLKPVYQASTQILVNQKTIENQIDYTLLQSNVDLINTYSGIIKSPAILEKAIDKLNINISWEELNQKIKVNNQDNSQIFSVTVENTNAEKAVEIANTISETFQNEIQHIMSVNNVSILAKAELKNNPVPVRPKPLFNITIGIVIGFLAGIGTALLWELFDNTLKNDQDVEQYLGLPVLGSIQKIPRVHKKGIRDLKGQKMEEETIVS